MTKSLLGTMGNESETILSDTFMKNLSLHVCLLNFDSKSALWGRVNIVGHGGTLFFDKKVVYIVLYLANFHHRIQNQSENSVDTMANYIVRHGGYLITSPNLGEFYCNYIFYDIK